jgi:hypothetical protein
MRIPWAASRAIGEFAQALRIKRCMALRLFRHFSPVRFAEISRHDDCHIVDRTVA